jgi:hypothetical protein
MEDIFSLLGAVRDHEDNFVGYIKQTSFKSSFFIEDLDFRFRCSSVKRHFTPGKFVEIICLDSIGAVYKEYGGAEISVETGVSVNRGGEADGELVFLPNIPVQGIRIIIDEDFYRSLQPDIFPQVFSDPGNSDITLRTTAPDPELRLVFGQIKRAMERDFAHEAYCKNKIAEIVCLLAHAESAKNKQNEKIKRIPPADIAALERVRTAIETQISDPPTMA